jgi:hypothetical protein
MNLKIILKLQHNMNINLKPEEEKNKYYIVHSHTTATHMSLITHQPLLCHTRPKSTDSWRPISLKLPSLSPLGVLLLVTETAMNILPLMGLSPGLGSPSPASLEMQTLYCNFLHFENTRAFSHPTSQLVNPRYPLKNP